VILKMGVKEVLHRTKHLAWGTDTHLYRTAADFTGVLPSRLQSAGPRVLKQNRGNGGQGVWKVELASELAGDGACLKKCHLRSSWHAARPISPPMDASWTNRFKRACAKA